MTAKKKSPDSNHIPTTRYRRRDQVVDVLEGTAVLEHTGAEYPPGVTSSDSGLLFQGMLISASSFLVYDELGNPLVLLTDEEFKATYEADFDQARGPDAMKGDLAQAATMVDKLTQQTLDQDARIDELRTNDTRLKGLIRILAGGLGLNPDDYASEEDFVSAVQGRQKRDNAAAVLRDILKIEAAQTRDDGGRIIHLNRKIIDRAVTVI